MHVNHGYAVLHLLELPKDPGPLHHLLLGCAQVLPLPVGKGVPGECARALLQLLLPLGQLAVAGLQVLLHGAHAHALTLLLQGLSARLQAGVRHPCQ